MTNATDPTTYCDHPTYEGCEICIPGWNDFCPADCDSGCEVCMPEADFLMGCQSSAPLAYCDTHDHIEVVTDCGSGPGFCTPMSWVSFACGATEVEGDYLES